MFASESLIDEVGQEPTTRARRRRRRDHRRVQGLHRERESRRLPVDPSSPDHSEPDAGHGRCRRARVLSSVQWGCSPTLGVSMGLFASSDGRGGLWRSRWAAIGAAVAVTFGAGGLFAANAASPESSTVSIAPVRVLDTRTDVGLAGPFVSRGCPGSEGDRLRSDRHGHPDGRAGRRHGRVPERHPGQFDSRRVHLRAPGERDRSPDDVERQLHHRCDQPECRARRTAGRWR